MASSTVRINQETLKVLRELAEQLGEPMPRILARAVEGYRRQKVLEQTNLVYAALRSDPGAWQQEQKERETWDIALADGLGEQ